MKKRFGKKKKPGEDMALQITSMADIFTIILVFLLQRYSIGLTTIAPSKDTVLPEAKANDEMKETLKLEIASDSILVDAKPAVQLTNFNFNGTDQIVNGISQNLYKALIGYRKGHTIPDQES